MIKKILKKTSIYLTAIEKIKIRKENKLIQKDDVIIKVNSCGICSSDLKFYFTGSRIKKFPIILGHEISGTIIEIDRKSNFKETNKKIVLGAEAPCGKCESCINLKHDTNLCDKPISVGSNYNGGFSNYFIIKKKILRRIPHIIYIKNKEIEYAALSESLACVVNGFEVTNFKKNQSVAIIGAGYMGLLFVGLAKIYGAKKILVVDLNKKRLQLAKKLGATDIFLSTNLNQEIIIKKIKNKIKTSSFNVVVSANGNIKSHELACSLVAKKGFVNLYGGIPKNLNKKISFDSNMIHYKQASITGSFSSNQSHLNKAFRIIKNKSIDFSKIITSIATFDSFNQKLYTLRNQEEIKSIFIPKYEKL